MSPLTDLGRLLHRTRPLRRPGRRRRLAHRVGCVPVWGQHGAAGGRGRRTCLQTIDPPYRSGMDRRSFLVTSLAGVIAAPLGAEAQREEKAWQVGVLGNSPSPHLDAAFRQGLRERGWIEGRNITLLYRYSEGRN
jgi:hypothetical protein